MCASVPDSVLLELVQTSRSDGGVATLDPIALANFLEGLETVERRTDYVRLRDFLDSSQSTSLKPAMRTALQIILRREGAVSAGDLAETGVFRKSPPSPEAIKSFRTRLNTILLDAGLSLTYSAKTHEMDIEVLAE